MSRSVLALFLALVVGLLLGFLIGIGSTYELVRCGHLPQPRSPLKPPWDSAAPFTDIAEKAIVAGRQGVGVPLLHEPGSGPNGAVYYCVSWTGATDPKKVLEEFVKEFRALVVSQGGSPPGRIEPIGRALASGERGYHAGGWIDLPAWSGWLNAWVVPGPNDQFSLIITIHPNPSD